MKTILTAAAIVAVCTLPAFADSDLLGTEAQGEADGSYKASLVDPNQFIGYAEFSGGQEMMMQGSALQRAGATGARAQATGTRTKARSGARAQASTSRAKAAGARAEVRDTASTSGNLEDPYAGWLFRPSSSGMDGGNRK